MNHIDDLFLSFFKCVFAFLGRGVGTGVCASESALAPRAVYPKSRSSEPSVIAIREGEDLLESLGSEARRRISRTKAFSSNGDLLAVGFVHDAVDFFQVVGVRDHLVSSDNVLQVKSC